jgi:hypothetical protein
MGELTQKGGRDEKEIEEKMWKMLII